MAEHNFEEIFRAISQMQQALGQVILGKDQFIDQLLAGFICGGHVLLEDAPGLGKTTTAKALAKLISGATVSRLQCTPDLLPYDITGIEYYDAKEALFKFEKGPVFADILLADELNRANPRTQSALLEAMAEAQVTISNQTYPLSSIFFVIATQNPLDNQATYALPLAELDRFLFKLSIGYPSIEDEKKLMQLHNNHELLDRVSPVMDVENFKILQESVHRVYCKDALIHLVASVAKASREHHALRLGVSPRASMQVIHGAKAMALIRQRDFVSDDDIKTILPLAFCHRVQSVEEKCDIPALILSLYQEAWQQMMML